MAFFLALTLRTLVRLVGIWLPCCRAVAVPRWQLSDALGARVLVLLFRVASRPEMIRVRLSLVVLASLVCGRITGGIVVSLVRSFLSVFFLEIFLR